MSRDGGHLGSRIERGSTVVTGSLKIPTSWRAEPMNPSRRGGGRTSEELKEYLIKIDSIAALLRERAKPILAIEIRYNHKSDARGEFECRF
ncbi:MAG: hypothetical protein PHN90_01085 [Methanothrix sp.]|nr:hypothetical protein [Methanothrix sp.]